MYKKLLGMTLAQAFDSMKSSDSLSKLISPSRVNKKSKVKAVKVETGRIELQLDTGEVAFILL